ncbi:MAG: hypothetical protein MRY79_00720 [Alphaproteobacteria bacterium]|nr:hypothetical protein [Alphaproteobacteria bacterium]
MATLDVFADSDKELIISLPYRVGIWISNVDDNEKTERDDKIEQQALEATIEKLAARHKKIPFAATIMREVKSHKSMWSAWEAQISEEQVIQDLSAAITLCRSKLSKRDVKEYKQAVWQVGLVVAQAFGEHIDPDNEMHVNNFFSSIAGLLTKPDLKKRPENMSAKEKTALKKLRAVLKS